MTPEKSLYSDQVMDHFLHPRNSGVLADATIEVEQLNEVCGDRMFFYVKLNGATIMDVKFRSYGCAVAIAAASMVTEAIKGKKLPAAIEAAGQALERVRTGTARDKSHCSNMVEQVWNKAVAQIEALKTG